MEINGIVCGIVNIQTLKRYNHGNGIVCGIVNIKIIVNIQIKLRLIHERNKGISQINACDYIVLSYSYYILNTALKNKLCPYFTF